MRLIDGDALKHEICNIPMCGEHEQFYAIVSEVVKVLIAAPTIDAVEVVRCAECRFSKPIPEHAAKAFNAELVRDCTYQRGDWKQVYGFSVVSVDGYCDEGERRMDAEEEKDE